MPASSRALRAPASRATPVEVLGTLIVIMANKESVIGDLRNRWWQNLFGAIGLIAIVASSLRLITTLIG